MKYVAKLLEQNELLENARDYEEYMDICQELGCEPESELEWNMRLEYQYPDYPEA
jgi:hypothetical protein